MARSLRRSPFVAIHLYRNIERVNTKEEKEIIKTWTRASTIVPSMLGHTIAIHNGKEHFPLLGERRELNPRMMDPQSIALIHLATSAPLKMYMMY